MDLSPLLAGSALLLLMPALLQPAAVALGEDDRRGLLWWAYWIDVIYCRIWHRLDSGTSPLPGHGAAILIANHTCAIDHFLLQVANRRVLGFLIAREFYEHRLYGLICRRLGCIPVNRDGRDLSATRAALRALKAGRIVPIFPEGEILPESGDRLAEFKTGVAFLALHANVPVIPAYISGTPREHEFIRSLLTPSHARVVYGEPIDPSTLFDHDGPGEKDFDKATLRAVADRLKEAIVALKDRPQDGR